jgi:hypothetical protein
MVKIATLQHLQIVEDNVNKLLNRQEKINMSRFDVIEAELAELRTVKDKVLAMMAAMKKIIEDETQEENEKITALAAQFDAVNKELEAAVAPQPDGYRICPRDSYVLQETRGISGLTLCRSGWRSRYRLWSF